MFMRSVFVGFANGETRPSLKPEERLLLAVVESAYWDLQSPDPGKRRTASTYFLDERDHHAFSFISICQHFSWSPGSIRGRLSQMLGSHEAERRLDQDPMRSFTRRGRLAAPRYHA